jgi:hypothetical protein
MVSEQEIHNAVASCHGTGKTFAEFLVEIFKDKFIEVYVGDAYEDVSTEQISTTYPAVFCGKVVAAYRECLVINCAYAASHSGGQIKLGNLVFVNERAIRALNEIDGKGTMEDMMLRSKESLAIKEMFSEHKKLR